MRLGWRFLWREEREGNEMRNLIGVLLGTVLGAMVCVGADQSVRAEAGV